LLGPETMVSRSVDMTGHGGGGRLNTRCRDN
jgi:hypothetical protein